MYDGFNCLWRGAWVFIDDIFENHLFSRQQQHGKLNVRGLASLLHETDRLQGYSKALCDSRVIEVERHLTENRTEYGSDLSIIKNLQEFLVPLLQGSFLDGLPILVANPTQGVSLPIRALYSSRQTIKLGMLRQKLSQCSVFLDTDR